MPQPDLRHIAQPLKARLLDRPHPVCANIQPIGNLLERHSLKVMLPDNLRLPLRQGVHRGAHVPLQLLLFNGFRHLRDALIC